MILGQDGATAGTCRIGPIFPEEVLYMTDGIVKDIKEAQPGTYDWTFDGKRLKLEPVVPG